MRLGAAGSIELVLPFDAVTQAQFLQVRPRGRLVYTTAPLEPLAPFGRPLLPVPLKTNQLRPSSIIS